MLAFFGVRKSRVPLLKWIPLFDLQKAGQSQNFYLYQIPVSKSGLPLECLVQVAESGFVRIFESCYIDCMDETDLQQEVVHLLFSIVAGDVYNDLIDAKRNVSCYNELFDGAQSRSARPLKSILDFGCGPGTVMASSLAREGVLLRGYDFVAENRELARTNGLDVFEVAELENLSIGTFDLILSCYVMHYETIAAAEIIKLSELIRAGGLWAANFHKSKGFTSFKKTLNKAGLYEIETCMSPFGLLVFATKIGNRDE
ncbi:MULTISPECIES: bifunctional 2-polyprenyl-6-hydroxyphenol methylase/3-demethylubiquinol 3-O-methyltransferase UbiG [unclassified Pseudomonas]|uniref:class I SAM-dependent methyltransferase n=1 Tax=unclassified Pseudomonas TaxID=196821 RepID=UPI000A089D64|nr:MULTISPECIES: class I SAM-dependent methyltransferase [unclassified Pseudomonas]SME95237.1 Methyltransferase domain-containing protein [Pseudomonas sp. LAMO17WK12:I1]